MIAPRNWRRSSRVAGIVIAAVVAAVGIAWLSIPGFPLGPLDRSPSTATVHASYAIDVHDPARLVGWADDVSLGRVIAQSGGGLIPDSNPDKSSDMPYTLYEVEVLKGLQDPLSGVVEILQVGGVCAGGTTLLWEGDPRLQAGETCLFITHGDYDPSAGWNDEQGPLGCPRLVNVYGDVRVHSEAEKTKVLSTYRTAVAEQVEPER